MNSVGLAVEVEAVNIQDRKDWVTCGLKVKNDRGIDLWLDVRSIKKSGKEMEWLPKLKGEHVFADARLTSYESKKTNSTVYTIAVSKSGLYKLHPDQAQFLLYMGRATDVKISGRVQEIREHKGTYFMKVGIKYAKPKDNSFGFYYARVQCPPDFDPSQHGEDSYITIFGDLQTGPDGKPLVVANCIA